MSTDAFRQNNTDKVANAVKPDSSKTFPERQEDRLAGKTDELASHAQPASHKSTGQQISDSKATLSLDRSAQGS